MLLNQCGPRGGFRSVCGAVMSRFEEIRRSAVSGAFWAGGGQVLRNGLSIATSLVLARLLVPEDYGLFALCVLAVEFAQMFANAGFGTTIVQSQSSHRSVLSTFFWLNLVVASACCLTMVLAAHELARIFDAPRLAPLLQAAAVGVVISGAMVVPMALLNQRLQFRDVVLSQLAGSVLGSIAAVAMAAGGAGVWSLVAQPIVGSLVTLSECLRRARWLPARLFDYSSVRGMMKLSGHLLVSDVIGYFSRSAWAGIIGRALGTQQVGLFNMAQQIVFLPVTQFSAVMVRVLFPTLSRLLDSPDDYRRVWLRAVGSVGFLTIPILIGLWASVEEFVPVVLGKQWMELIPILHVLCFVAAVQSVGTIAGTILLSGAHGSALMGNSVFSLCTMVTCLWIGQRWGLQGVTIGFAVGSMAPQIVMLYSAVHLSKTRISDFVSALAPTVACTIGMAGFMRGSSWFFGELLPWQRLTFELLVGAVSYLALSYAFNRGPINLLLGALAGRRAAGAALD